MPTDLTMWVIYSHPDDYPQGFVTRKWSIHTGRPWAGDGFTAPDLMGARAHVPFGLVRMEPAPNDDPKIVEVWL